MTVRTDTVVIEFAGLAARLHLVPGLIVRQIPDNAQSIVAVFVTAC